MIAPGRNHQRLAFCLSLSIVAALSACSKNPQPRRIPPPPPRPSEDFALTDVWPHTAAPLVSGRNYVFCGSMQLAWNELADAFGEGGVIRLQGMEPTSELLNERRFTKLDLTEDSYVAVADLLNPAGERRLVESLHSRFPVAIPPALNWQSNLPFTYAYLDKQLTFENVFHSLPPAPFPVEDGTRVQWFGIDPNYGNPEDIGLLLSQLVVRHYRAPDEFIVELQTDNHNDELLLARIPKADSLELEIGKVRELSASADRALHPPVARLAIPVVSLGISKRYPELIGVPAVGAPQLAQGLGDAQQIIRFQLDRRGAVLQSEAFAAAASEVSTRPVDLVFDRPFLVILQRRGSVRPYLAAWIENAEVLLGAP